MDALVFDSLAETTLHSLLRALDVIDEIDAELSQGVLTISFAEGSPYIVNSHRAAGQIWLAADRMAWHFTPADDQRWVSDKPPFGELSAVLETALSNKFGRPVSLGA